MRGLPRYRRWSLVLAMVLGPCFAATAQPQREAAPLQLFSTVQRPVVAVRVAFRVDVEAYATPGTEAAEARVAAAFAAARFPEAPGLELLREDPLPATPRRKASSPLVLRRRFVFRATRPGAVRLPPLSVRLGARRYTTAAHALTAYEVDPEFFHAGLAVLPVQAEYEGLVDGQRYARIGSAFIVGADAVVTSLHVIIDADRVWLTLPNGKRISTRKAWVLDPTRDVAVLYVKPKDLRRAGVSPLALAPTEAFGTEAAVAFTNGWPGGTQRSTAGLRFRGVTLQPGEPLWMSANPVRPGDSGGPLLDAQGRVLGVVTSGSVNKGRPTMLSEEMCIALDPRPALARKRGMVRPRSLRSLMRAPQFAGHPHVQAIRLMSALAVGRRLPSGLQDALDRLDTIPPDDPGNARLHFLHGLIYQMLGTHGEAADAYRASLDAYEGHFLAAYMLGMYHLRGRDYAAAEALFRHARRFDPYTHIASYGLARSLMGRLRYEEATPHLDAVVAHDPSYAPALYDLALVALAHDDEIRARQLLAKLEALNAASARRLRRVLREPLLRPRALRERPRVPFHTLPPMR